MGTSVMPKPSTTTPGLVCYSSGDEPLVNQRTDRRHARAESVRVIVRIVIALVGPVHLAGFPTTPSLDHLGNGLRLGRIDLPPPFVTHPPPTPLELVSV